MTRRFNTSHNGFTLLEMVIILGIIGTMLGTFLSFYQPMQTARANADSKIRMERVLNAVSSFALQFNRLPCPASPTEGNANNFGTAIGACAGNNRSGIIPYRTLGLTQEDAQDGFGRYFTYIVDTNATVTPFGSLAADLITRAVPPTIGSYFCTNTTALTIRRTIGGTSTNETTNAAVVLIAYGPDGFGAYNMTQTNNNARSNPIGEASLNSTLGTQERGNAVDQTGAGITTTDITDYNGTVNPVANHFDDQVMYMTAPGVVSRLGVAGCH